MRRLIPLLLLSVLSMLSVMKSSQTVPLQISAAPFRAQSLVSTLHSTTRNLPTPVPTMSVEQVPSVQADLPSF